MIPHTDHLLAISMPGGMEWIIILAIGLLLFGKRLPEVGRSLGRGIVEFKRGVKGIEEEIDSASRESESRSAPQIQSGAEPGEAESDDRRVSRSETPSQA